MVVRKAPATEEEVLRAVSQLSERRGSSIRFYTAPTIAGLIAGYRGCPESWPDNSTTAQYVSFSSVRRTIDKLVADGKLYAVPGTHWSVPGASRNRVTYYVDDAKRNQLIADKEDLERRKTAQQRDLWVSEKLHQRYRQVVEELCDQYDREHKPTDWRSKW